MSDMVTITRYRGPRGARLRAFLKKYVENIGELSVEYCNVSLEKMKYMDYNLLSDERGSYSLMSAAMQRITPIHRSEFGVIRRVDRRRRGNQGRSRTASGRVDLWSYLNGVEYFFEFKRSYISPYHIYNNAVPGKIANSWTNLVNQVTAVKQGIAKDPDYQGYESRTYFIGLQIITLRQRSSRLETLQSIPINHISQNTLRTWLQNLAPNADDILAWRITPEEQRIRPIDWDNDGQELKWESMPCHLFCFKIERN